MQGFSLPGETDKAAKILGSFLADPTRPATALNAIPKAVLQRAKGACRAVGERRVSDLILRCRNGQGLLSSLS